MTGTATAGTTKFSWSDHRTIAHALGGLDGRDYLNSREGFLAMYQQGVRLFELDLSRTSDGVWVCRHNWKESMGQWKGSGKKVLTEKQFKNSKIYGTYTPMTLEDFFLLLKEHPDAYVMIDSKQYSLRNYQRTLEHIASFCEEKGIPAATIYWKYWSEETEQIFEKKGIRLYVYTVNDRNQARKYIAQGAEGICTDFLTADDLW